MVHRGEQFYEGGKRSLARQVVTSETQVIEAGRLPPGTSAQKAELTAVSQPQSSGEGRS